MGTQIPLRQKEAEPPIFGPCLLWPSGSMHEDCTWYGGMPRPSEVVRWGPSSLLKGTRPPVFGLCLLWPNGWMDEHSTWYGSRPQPRPHCVRWGHSSSPPEKEHSSTPLFGACLLWPWLPISATAELLNLSAVNTALTEA